MLGHLLQFVELLQWCLYCNRCNPRGFGGIFDTATQDAVELFQKELALPGTPGVADINVWESLLVSCGNKNRSARACDTATTLTYESAKALKDAGYDVVGRYLTNRFAMTSEEINNIFKAGLEIFAIYEYGSTLSYYSESGRGTTDGEAARNAALALGIPAGTVLYFAIDYDMENYQVTDVVIPYFEEINNVIAPYSVGIYGSRNVCSRVSESGLAVSSFVLDMSTGYSGNLGYTMPDNWNFDQFATVTTGGVGIDKDGYKPTSEFAITFNKARSIQGNRSNEKQEMLNIFNKIFDTEVAMSVFNEPIVLCDTSAFMVTVEGAIAIDPPSANNEITINRNGTMTLSRTVGPVMFNQDFFNKQLNKFSAQSVIQNMSVEMYNNGGNSLYFTVPNIDPLTLKADIYLTKDDVVASFTITVKFGKGGSGSSPTNLPNAQLVSYFTELAAVIGGAYATSPNIGLRESKNIVAEISIVAVGIKGFKYSEPIFEMIGNFLENVVRDLEAVPK